MQQGIWYQAHSMTSILKSVEFVGVAWPVLILTKLKLHVPWSVNQKQYPLFWRQWIYSWNLFLPSFTYQNGEHHTNTKANNKSFDPCWPAQGSCIRYLVKSNNYYCERFEPRSHFKSRLSLIVRENVVLKSGLHLPGRSNSTFFWNNIIIKSWEMVLTFESVNEILHCHHSIKTFKWYFLFINILQHEMWKFCWIFLTLVTLGSKDLRRYSGI